MTPRTNRIASLPPVVTNRSSMPISIPAGAVVSLQRRKELGSALGRPVRDIGLAVGFQPVQDGGRRRNVRLADVQAVDLLAGGPGGHGEGGEPADRRGGKVAGALGEFPGGRHGVDPPVDDERPV